MRKKLLCLLLAGCMMFSSAIPAIADHTEQSTVSEVSDSESYFEDVIDDVESDGTESDDITDASDETIVAETTDQESETIADADVEETESQDAVAPEANTIETISYQAHVSNIGWMDYVSSKEYDVFAGTTGKNLAMEALKINSEGMEGLMYSAHVSNIGWMKEVSADDDTYTGTTGRNLPMEAVKIRFEDGTENAEKYDVYYRAHVTNFGWLGWAKNGEQAGSMGYAYTLQAVEIKILPKGQTPVGYNASKDAFKAKLRVFGSASVKGKGWLSTVEANGNIIGTTGQNRYIDAIKFSSNMAGNTSISYSTHISDIGWSKEITSDHVSGVSGSGRQMEAIKIWMTGDNADKYDIYYQAHVANVGWLDWAKNGEEAGSSGLGYALEAIRVTVVSKGAKAPGSTGCSFVTKTSFTAQGYSQGYGWLSSVGSGQVIGTTGKASKLQGLKMSVSGIQNTTLQYSTHVSNVGWMASVTNGAESGKPGSNEQIESVSIQLSGPGSRYYNVWYRVHSANLGWLDWAKNGEYAGTAKLNYAAEAIQVVILPKTSAAPGATSRAFVDTKSGWVYVNGYRRYKDEKGNLLNDVTHLFNPSQKRITVDCYSGITTVYGYNSATSSYDTPIRAFYCSVGRTTSKTPSGTYHIYRKYSSKVMNASDGSYHVWAPYISCFNGAIYFHGVASVSTTPNQVSAATWAALGNPASSGCVRLAGIEAKWIYDNCPVGTTVYVGSYSSPLPSPLTGIKYAWKGGSVAGDPTL